MNTMMTYYKVRKGGPKDKRIRRVELMGEHTPKPLHYLKVTQSIDSPPVDAFTLIEEFEKQIGDGSVGDAYRPINPETKLVREFAIVGFFKREHALDAAKVMKEFVINGVQLEIEVAKSWFVDLYPRPADATLTDYKRMVKLQEP
jgi:hypothetical protein